MPDSTHILQTLIPGRSLSLCPTPPAAQAASNLANGQPETRPDLMMPAPLLRFGGVSHVCTFAKTVASGPV